MLWRKTFDLLLTGEEGKRHYVFIKDINTFTCLQAFLIEKILKHHIRHCFKINGKQRIIMSKKGDYVKFKNYERKIKSPCHHL